MRVLGIDPGSWCMGYGLIDALPNGDHRYVASGHLALKGELPERLLQIEQGLSTILEKYCPDAVAVETVFVQRFAKAALILGHARGAVLLTVAKKMLPIAEYSARLVKKSVVGYGNASKGQMQHMVKHLLCLQGLPQADAADALAVAFCHLAHI